MIRALIIDDEQHCIDRLSALLEEYCKHAVIVLGAYKTIDDGIAAIGELNPELIFLDVQIGKKTGFDLLDKINHVSFNVIFTTAHDKYAVRAFKFNALDYLLKPIDPDDMQQAVEKYRHNVVPNNTSQKIDELMNMLKHPNSAPKKINVPTITGFVFLNVSDIIRCQSDVNYTTIFLNDKSKLIVAKTLKEFEEMLVDYNFFRIHNSHLINLTYIKGYNKGKGGFVTMYDNSEIEVSVRKKEAFLNRLSEM